jgi:hypothetical protein
MEPTLQRVDARRSSGLCSSTTVSSWWLLLPGVVAAFLLQHAIQVPPAGARIPAPGLSHPDRDRLRALCAKSPAGDFRELPTVAQGPDRAAPHEFLLAMQR